MSTAFAFIKHKQNYYDFYEDLLDYVKAHFSNVESGIQGDAWIWITQDNQKVSLDTFYSMQFEINSESQNELLQTVMKTLSVKYQLSIYEMPIER